MAHADRQNLVGGGPPTKEAVNLFWSGLLWSPWGGGRYGDKDLEDRNLVLTPSRSDLVVQALVLFGLAESPS